MENALSTIRFTAILDEIRTLHDKKGADYGSPSDPYANVRSAADFGVPPWVGAIIRLNDKVTRLKAFIRNGKLKNEGVEDAFRDIQVYAVIAQVLWEEERKVTNPKFDPTKGY